MTKISAITPLISGLYPNQSHVANNEATLQPVVPGLGETFSKAGYHTGYVGKSHLYKGENQFVPRGPYRFGFENWHVWANTNKHYDGITFDEKTGERQTIAGYQPTRMTDQAIGFLDAQKGAAKPWSLVVNWNPTHPPFDPPAEDRDRYDASTLKFRPSVRLPIWADRLTNPYPQLQSMQTLHQRKGATMALSRAWTKSSLGC